MFKVAIGIHPHQPTSGLFVANGSVEFCEGVESKFDTPPAVTFEMSSLWVSTQRSVVIVGGIDSLVRLAVSVIECAVQVAESAPTALRFTAPEVPAIHRH
jgi:hypothetical protein